MPHLPVSEIGSSSGCGRYLSDRIRRGSGIRGESGLRGSEAQIVGTGVHEIIQFVLSKPPHTRRDAAREMIDALEEMRTTMAVPSLIEEAVPQKFFSDGLSQQRIVNTWQSSIHLLNGALNFLDHLEKKVPPSAGNGKSRPRSQFT